MDVPGVDEAKLKAWGWSDTSKPASKTETLSAQQVADLDPFGLRKLRASEAADEFLRVGQEDVKDALAALHDIDVSKLPKKVRKLLEKSRATTSSSPKPQTAKNCVLTLTRFVNNGRSSTKNTASRTWQTFFLKISR